MTDSTSSLGNSQAVIDKDGRVTLKISALVVLILIV